ncbi:MAG: hypothetical protein RJA44_1416 [Pseudomonadota bacterium]|jgi:predicted PurR-regulated permease PerM
MTLPLKRLALIWLGLLLGLLLLIWLLAPVLTPFVLAGALAYALLPAVNRLAWPRGRWPRLLAAAVVELLALLLITCILLLLVPIILRELPLLRDQVPQQVQRLIEQLRPWLLQFGIPFDFDQDSVRDFIVRHISTNAEELLSAVLSSARVGGSFVFALLANLLLVPVVAYYVLIDWPQLRPQLGRLVPLRLQTAAAALAAECDEVLGQYLRGQLSVMLILALYYSVALALGGFELAVPVGVFTGLAVCVPYLGFGLGALLALLAGVLQYASWYGVWVVAVVYGAGQVIEGFFLTPRLVGERIGLHPATVIFLLLAFGHLFGFVGVLVALPVGALGLVLWRRLLQAYLASRFYQG